MGRYFFFSSFSLLVSLISNLSKLLYRSIFLRNNIHYWTAGSSAFVSRMFAEDTVLLPVLHRPAFPSPLLPFSPPTSVTEQIINVKNIKLASLARAATCIRCFRALSEARRASAAVLNVLPFGNFEQERGSFAIIYFYFLMLNAVLLITTENCGDLPISCSEQNTCFFHSILAFFSSILECSQFRSAFASRRLRFATG